MQWGKQARQLEELHDAGMSVPAIDNRPDIYGFEWLWEAFIELNSCRVSGMSLGLIPWTAVQQYSKALQMTEDETWLLHKVVQHLDGLFVEHQAKQREKKDHARR